MKPKKMEEGKFPKLRKMGKKGERVIEDMLKSQGYRVLRLDFESPYNETTDMERWAELPKLPDGLAKKGDEVFFFEVKTKSRLMLVVNQRNYKEYLPFLEFFPVFIYFYIETTGAIYKHVVAEKEYPTRREWNGNMVYVLDDYVEQIA